MRPRLAPFALASFTPFLAGAADALQSKTTYAKAYGETKNAVTVDPAKDLPRYPAVEPNAAIDTWKVKPGFKLQFAAHEPQVRDPIAICFDERGRMFVCEMIDYSEMRDVTPHLGRISMLEDKDGDGYYETSTVFADDLPWPTGLIWANGGLYVGATPDIWRLEDRDGDGKAEVRTKAFTGFGTGLKLLNVQGLMNSFQWGADNRVHVLAGGGNRGVITSPVRPDLPGQELGGRDFWFDPRTHEFGVEAGGAQYGMSFDDYGRKFACSNSDHLQFWVYDQQLVPPNPLLPQPNPRQSIAADGGAAEVFRISPDEPWRIIRTRWRIAGVVKGAVEGGGRVSGYFTGATGTTVFRGDAYGPDFVNNTFTGDAGGQLVHRKQITEDGVSLVGRRPEDEKGFEFAASRDTWVRVVNFANAPDGCLYICDMYREVIEHPWSIPDEIKKHIDLNSGNDRGRLYRLVPDRPDWQRRSRTDLASASTADLVQTLSHPNGWHRDTASRLLYERQDASAVGPLEATIRSGPDALARFHALGVLSGLSKLSDNLLSIALSDRDAHIREHAVELLNRRTGTTAIPAVLVPTLQSLADDPAPRVRLQLAFLASSHEELLPTLAKLAKKDHSDPWISAALLSGSSNRITGTLLAALTETSELTTQAADFIARLIELRTANKPTEGYQPLIDFVTTGKLKPAWLHALGNGLRRAGTSLEKADTSHRLDAIVSKAAAQALDARSSETSRLEAIETLGFSSSLASVAALESCLASAQPERIQTAALAILARNVSPATTRVLIDHWPAYQPGARATALTALLSRDDRTLATLKAVTTGPILPADFAPSQVQTLLHHKDSSISALARTALASVIPPTREVVVAKFQPAIAAKGDAARGQLVYQSRCLVCHRAGSQGMSVGPDLITVKTKGRDALLTAILEPNKEVASQYIAYAVATKDGQNLNGLIAKDDATSLTVRLMGGGDITIPRSSIKGTSSEGKSLMPEGVETGLTVQEMADLLSFIEELK